MARKRGIIGLEVEGLSAVRSAATSIANGFAKAGLVIDGVKKVLDQFKQAWDFLEGTLNRAASDQAINATFTALAGGAQKATQMLDGLREATGKQVSDTDLQIAANKILRGEYGLTTQQIGDLLAATVAMGNTTGKTAVESVNALTDALASGRTKGLGSSLGLVVDSERALNEYAKSVNKSTEELTVQEKRMVALKEVMGSLGRQSGQLAEANTPLAESSNRISATWANMQSKIDELIATSPGFAQNMERMAEAAAQFAVDIAKAASELAPLLELISSLAELSPAGLLGIISPSLALFNELSPDREATPALKQREEQRRISEAAERLGRAAGGSEARRVARQQAQEIEDIARQIELSEGGGRF